MELIHEIPIFQKKELDIDYVNELGCMSDEDMQLTGIFDRIVEYGLKPSMEQISALLSYKNQAMKHASDLIMLLDGSDSYVSFGTIHNFVMKYDCDKNCSYAEILVFSALSQLHGEIKTIQQILEIIQEPNQSNVEKPQSTSSLSALFG